MSTPTVYYICKFPKSFRDYSWFDGWDKDSAVRFVRRIRKQYGVRGTVKKVVEVEEK